MTADQHDDARVLPGPTLAFPPDGPSPDWPYELLDELGRGSRTIAYRVRRGDGVYALKVLRERAGEPAAERAFRREAALLAGVDHPGLARVHEVGTVAGRPYLVMDLVDGRRLTDVLAAGPLDLTPLLAIGVEVADALGAAHRAGLVHRDIKPDNVLVTPDGARVIDFGLAARLGAEEGGGTVAGTLLYCAPEQAGMLHRPVDGRADLYALGAVLYECATGAPPFTADDVGELLRLHATAPPRDPRAERRDLPPALGTVILKLLAKDPDDRYQSCAGLVADLRRLAVDPRAVFPLGLADRPPTGKPEPPLTGRAGELGVLTTRWRRARSGDGGAVLLSGPPGGGKSRLARELAAIAAADGGIVLHGKCAPDATVPMAPLRAAFDRYVERVAALPPARRVAAGVDLVAAAGPAAAILRTLSPALGALLDVPENAVGGDGPPAPAVAGFLAALARSGNGLVLCLDDVHWLDDATRRVLGQLATEVTDRPLLIVTTARDDESGLAGLAAARQTLGPALDLDVRLDPLSPVAVAELVTAATGGIRVDPATATRLAARSDGNPFTLLQFVDAMVDGGLARPSWGTWVIDADLLHGIELPFDAVALVLDRLSGLDPESRQMLGVAAALGPSFTPLLLAEVCRIHQRQVIEVLSTAAWRHLVERRGGESFQFLHDRIREALLAQFDPPTLRAIHGRIAEVLSGHDQSSPEVVYALASHAQLAGAVAHRVHAACAAAGMLALADHAPAEAMSLLERAAAAAREAGITPDAGFLRALGLAQHRTGRFRDAVGTLEGAVLLAVGPIERARVLATLAQVHDSTWATTEQAGAVDRALAELGRPLPRSQVALVASTAGSFLLGCLVGATRLGYGTARDENRELAVLLASLYDTGSRAYARQLRPLVALVFTARRVHLTNRIGPGAETARMYASAAHLAHTLRLHRPAARAVRSARRSAEQVGDPRLIAYVDWLDACDRHLFGIEGPDGPDRLRSMLTERARWLDGGHRIDLLSILCWDSLLRGDLDAAEELFARRAREVAAVDGASPTTLHACPAGLLALQGRAAEAVAQLATARGSNQPQPWERIDLIYVAMLIAVEQNDLGPLFDEAAAELIRCRVQPGELLPVQRGLYVYLAYGRIGQCRTAPAREHPTRLRRATRALRLLRLAANTPLLKAHHRVAAAALQLAAGRPDRALRALNHAEPALRMVDAPLVAFEAARVRADALRALDVTGEAHRQARLALALAVEQRWPHRARQVAGSYGLEGRAPLPAGPHRSSDGVALSRYRHRLDAIQQVGLASARAADPEKLVTVALDETIRILGAERAFLFLVEPETGRLHPFLGRTADGANVDELTGYSATVVDRVRGTRESLVLTGAEDRAAVSAESVVQFGLRSILAAPLQVDSRLLGVVYLDSRVAKGIFTTDDVGVLTAILSHVAVALETTRATRLERAAEAATRQRDLAETLRHALAEITGIIEPTPTQVLERLLDAVFGLVGGDRAWLVERSGDPRRVRVTAAPRGPTPSSAWPPPPTAARASGNAPLVGEPLWLDADAGLARAVEAETATVGAGPDSPLLVGAATNWLVVPLVARRERLGVLLFAADGTDTYDPAVTGLASALVEQGMIAFENARLFAQVRQLATIDGLTGVANRRHFFELAADELRRVRQGRHALAAMMIDVDFFKRVNDQHGHQVGDEVIREVAGRLRQFGPPGSLVGRYGGEEFAMLLRASEVDAARHAERLRSEMAATPIETAAGPLPVTISVGVTAMVPDDVSGGAHSTTPTSEAAVGGLLARADRCLYLAKHSGRNRIHIG